MGKVTQTNGKNNMATANNHDLCWYLETKTKVVIRNLCEQNNGKKTC